jgi:hypothetical protein
VTTSAAARRRGLRRTDLLLVVAVLALSVPFLREWTTQPASRYLFTVALVDDRTTQLDPYATSLGLDYAIIDGHHYSDKAPYQPFAATPVYWAYRALGGDPFPRGVPGVEMGSQVDIGLWLVTLWSATIPAAILIVLLHRHVARIYPKLAVKAPLALLFGTVLLPFSSLLFGHLLAATAGFAAWFIIRRSRPPAAALVGAGVLLGAGIGIEYTQVLVAAVIGITSIVLLRTRAAWVAAGGAVGAIPLLVVNATTFGGPFKTAYQGYLPNFQGTGAFGVYNLVAPIPREFGLALVGDRGLLSLTPIMIIAILGCVLAIRGRTPARIDSIVALVLLGLFLLVSTGIDGYGGSSPGPRYLVPVLPFFVVPLAEGWRRWPGLAAITAFWSAWWMVLATITDPLYSEGRVASIDWLRDALSGDFDRSLPGVLLEPWAILVFVAIAGICAATALRLGDPPELAGHRPGPPVGADVATPTPTATATAPGGPDEKVT